MCRMFKRESEVMTLAVRVEYLSHIAETQFLSPLEEAKPPVRLIVPE